MQNQLQNLPNVLQGIGLNPALFSPDLSQEEEEDFAEWFQIHYQAVHEGRGFCYHIEEELADVILWRNGDPALNAPPAPVPPLPIVPYVPEAPWNDPEQDRLIVFKSLGYQSLSQKICNVVRTFYWIFMRMAQ